MKEYTIDELSTEYHVWAKKQLHPLRATESGFLASKIIDLTNENRALADKVKVLEDK